jgi:hypothetical protein
MKRTTIHTNASTTRPRRATNKLGILATLAASIALASLGSTVARARAAKPLGSPAVFLTHVVRLIAANRYAEAYPLLNPQQKRLISEREYVQCELASPVPGHLSSLRVLRITQQRIQVAGGSRRPVPATAVTFKLKLTGTLPHETATVAVTAHAVPAGHHWTWILSRARLALHRSGTCGVETHL